MPEEPLEQERFKRRLIATARSLKKKQQKLQADQDLLNDRWTNVLAAEEYGLKHPAKSYLKCKLLPQFDDEALKPIPPAHNAADGPTDHHVARAERQLMPNTSPLHLVIKVEKQRLKGIHMTYKTWKIKHTKSNVSNH